MSKEFVSPEAKAKENFDNYYRKRDMEVDNRGCETRDNGYFGHDDNRRRTSRDRDEDYSPRPQATQSLSER